MGDRPWSACFARTLQFFCANSSKSGRPARGAQGRRSCKPSMVLASVARYAMMSIVPTLLVAVVTFIAIMSSAGPPATGEGLGCGAVSRFVCVHCTSTGKLSSSCLFLARAAVRHHISATKSCREAGLGFREVHVEARAGDVMAGLSRRSGWRGGAGAGRSTPATRRKRVL